MTLFSATADSLQTLRGQLGLLHRSHVDLATKPVPQAVDPTINRKLVSHAPLSTIEIGSTADANATLELLVEGMEGVWDLSVRDGKRESVLDILVRHLSLWHQTWPALLKPGVCMPPTAAGVPGTPVLFAFVATTACLRPLSDDGPCRRVVSPPCVVQV